MSIWHSRLLEVVEELGEPTLVDVRRRFIDLYGHTFGDYDWAVVEGTTHWYRKVLWARDDLVKEGKLAQEGDKLFIPSKDNPIVHDVLPMIDFKDTLFIYIFIIVLIVLLVILGGK